MESLPLPSELIDIIKSFKKNPFIDEIINTTDIINYWLEGLHNEQLVCNRIHSDNRVKQTHLREYKNKSIKTHVEHTFRIHNIVI
jgi:hypothetical protein